jgi:hypothetical protein
MNFTQIYEDKVGSAREKKLSMGTANFTPDLNRFVLQEGILLALRTAELRLQLSASVWDPPKHLFLRTAHASV